MRCVAMVVRGKNVIPCDALCTGKYCVQHQDRERVHADALERERIIAGRIREARKTHTPTPAPIRPRRKLHSRLQWIVDAMDEEKYYGRDAHERTLLMIEQENRSVTQDILAGTLDGFESPAITRDLDELVLRSRGKMLATRLRLAERDAKNSRTDKEDAHSHTANGKAAIDKRTRKLSLEEIRAARRGAI